MNYYSFEILIEKKPEDNGYYTYSPTLVIRRSAYAVAATQNPDAAS
jgi:hypothetical protein